MPTSTHFAAVVGNYSLTVMSSNATSIKVHSCSFFYQQIINFVSSDVSCISCNVFEHSFIHYLIISRDDSGRDHVCKKCFNARKFIKVILHPLEHLFQCFFFRSRGNYVISIMNEDDFGVTMSALHGCCMYEVNSSRSRNVAQSCISSNWIRQTYLIRQWVHNACQRCEDCVVILLCTKPYIHLLFIDAMCHRRGQIMCDK